MCNIEQFLDDLALKIKEFLLATAVLELEQPGNKPMVKDAKLFEFIEFAFGPAFYERLREI